MAQLRSVVRAYEAVVRRFPTSGYSDNALWQGANVAVLAFDRFNQGVDRATAIRLFKQLKEQYPASSLIAPLRIRASPMRSPRIASPSTTPRAG